MSHWFEPNSKNAANDSVQAGSHALERVLDSQQQERPQKKRNFCFSKGGGVGKTVNRNLEDILRKMHNQQVK